MDTNSLTNKALNELFGDRHTEFDLSGGVVRMPNNERQVFISSETIWGLYKSLSDETGDAWRVVMKRCGYLWGKRFMDSLSRDVSDRLGHGAGDLTVAEYVDMIETYFSFHGWGRLAIDLTNAEAGGFIQCKLSNSIITQALIDVPGMVDDLVSGMLTAVFEFVAGRELDCIQVSCSRRGTSSHCEFLVSAPERISSIEPVAGKVSVDDAITELRAA